MELFGPGFQKGWETGQNVLLFAWWWSHWASLVVVVLGGPLGGWYLVGMTRQAVNRLQTVQVTSAKNELWNYENWNFNLASQLLDKLNTEHGLLNLLHATE